jgi:hypothetical protein
MKEMDSTVQISTNAKQRKAHVQFMPAVAILKPDIIVPVILVQRAMDISAQLPL